MIDTALLLVRLAIGTVLFVALIAMVIAALPLLLLIPVILLFML